MTWTKPEIIDNVPTKYGWTVSHPDRLELGYMTDIGSGTYLQCQHGIIIQDNVQIGGNCNIYSADTIGGNAGMVTIKEGACIGTQSIIMPGCTIGMGAIVMANSFVPANTNIPDGESWGGIPARPHHNVYVVTGGTGSIGRSVVERLLLDDTVDAVRVYSRDEAKQAAMKADLERTHSGYDCTRIRYILGDIRDKEKLVRALHEASVVIHAAALKRVETCEYNPDEAGDVNWNGTRMVISACFDTNVKKMLMVSTDKAVNPTNAMGTSKAMAEKVTLNSNLIARKHGNDAPRPSFYVARLGNVLESRGSVLPTWRDQALRDKEIIVTDRNATRYFIENKDVATFILDCLERPAGLYVPDCKVMKIGDLADAFVDSCTGTYPIGIRETEMRPGERQHEFMVSDEEALERGLKPEQYQSEKATPLTFSQIKELL